MRQFLLVLIKPSHYGEDGYVIRWLRTTIPSNSLAAVYGIAADCAERRVLGPDVDIEIDAFDETNTRIDIPKLLERFRRLGNAVLVASASFWEGVDVRGEALRLVVIDKLPFAPPDDPVMEERLKAIARAGRSAFMDYQLPLATLALKQGAGRLIRDERDHGVLMVADLRLGGRLDALAAQHCPPKRRRFHCALYDALAAALVLRALCALEGRSQASLVQLVRDSVSAPAANDLMQGELGL